MQSLDLIIKNATDLYLESIDMDAIPEDEDIIDTLVTETRNMIACVNQVAPKGQKYPMVTGLTCSQIADVIMKIYCVVNINFAKDDDDTTELGIYNPDEGIYETKPNYIRKVIRKYNYTITDSGIKEVLSKLMDIAPIKQRTMEPHLIPLANGVFNFLTKELEEFTSDYVFVTKADVEYNPNAKNVVITNPDGSTWDIESWMEGFYDDNPEMTELLWCVVAASVRYFHPWKKSVWFLSTVGNNGKGTLLSLMRNLIGVNNCCSISLEAMSKEFMLEPLIRSNAILVDECSVGAYVDDVSTYKAIVTEDPFRINRKNRKPLSYLFKGFTTFCVNDYPRIKDKTQTFYRRLLVIPFVKSFKGCENKAIKDDYLKRKDVLEYVMYKVLHMDFNELPEPEMCKEMLTEYQTINDPMRQFWADVRDEFVWDYLPLTFLYDLYKAWMAKFQPGGKLLGKKAFKLSLQEIVDNGWSYYDGQKKVCGMMDKPEPLILTYGLDAWRNPTYTGGDVDKVCTTAALEKYTSCIVRG